jgi:hypothetical protein
MILIEETFSGCELLSILGMPPLTLTHIALKRVCSAAMTDNATHPFKCQTGYPTAIREQVKLLSIACTMGGRVRQVAGEKI